jgi:hypothetical protein
VARDHPTLITKLVAGGTDVSDIWGILGQVTASRLPADWKLRRGDYFSLDLYHRYKSLLTGILLLQGDIGSDCLLLNFRRRGGAEILTEV